MDEKNKALYYCVQCHKEQVLVEGSKCLNCLSKELKDKLDNAVTYTEKDKYRQELEKIDDLIVKQKKIQSKQNIKELKLKEKPNKENSIEYDDFSNDRIMCSECGLLEVKNKGDKCVFCQLSELRKKSKLSKQNHKDEEADVYDLEYVKLGEKLEQYRSKLKEYASDKNEPYADEYKKALDRVNDMLSAFVIKKNEEDIKDGSKTYTTAKYLCQFCHSAMVENGGYCPKCHNKNGSIDNIDSVVKSGQVKDYFKNKYKYQDNSIGEMIEKSSIKDDKKDLIEKKMSNLNNQKDKSSNLNNGKILCSECHLVEVPTADSICPFCYIAHKQKLLKTAKNDDERKLYRKQIDNAKDYIVRYEDMLEKSSNDVSNKKAEEYQLMYHRFTNLHRAKVIIDNQMAIKEGTLKPENALYLCSFCHRGYVRDGEKCSYCGNSYMYSSKLDLAVHDREVVAYFNKKYDLVNKAKNESVNSNNDNKSINGYKLCPICHMNYIPVQYSCCKVCRWSKANIDEALYPNPDKPNMPDKKVDKITNENIAKTVANSSGGNASKMKMVNGKLMEVHSVESNRNYDFDKMTSMQRAYLSVKGKSYKNYLSLMKNKEQMEKGVARNGKKIEGNLLKAFQINTSKMEAKKKALDKTRWNLARIVYSEQSRAKKQNYVDYQYIRDSAMANIFKYHKSKMGKK